MMVDSGPIARTLPRVVATTAQPAWRTTVPAAGVGIAGGAPSPTTTVPRTAPMTKLLVCAGVALSLPPVKPSTLTRPPPMLSSMRGTVTPARPDRAPARAAGTGAAHRPAACRPTTDWKEAWALGDSGVRFGLICKSCDVVQTFSNEHERDVFAEVHALCDTESIRLVTR